MANASRYFSFVLSLFPITLWVERGEDHPSYNSKRDQKRLNWKTRRFLNKRDKFLRAEEELRDARNRLMDEVGESVRYVEIVIDGHTYRILLGYSELEGDPAAVAAALGDENRVIFDKALERNFVATVTIPYKLTFSVQRIVEAIQAVVAKKGGRVEYDQREPIKQRINRGILEFWCDTKSIPFPDDAFPDRRYARTYVDPVKKLDW